jgi:hypothetical protein
MDENYSLMHFSGLCGGWLVIWLTYALGHRPITLRMLFALVAGFAMLFALARPFVCMTLKHGK